MKLIVLIFVSTFLLASASAETPLQGPAFLPIELNEEIVITRVITPCGLETGDRLLRIAEEPVRSVSHLEELIKSYRPGDIIRVSLMRKNLPKTIPLRLTEKPTSSLLLPLTGLNQEVIDPVAWKGTTVVLFWATWCRLCKRLEPLLSALPTSFPNVRFVALSSESRARIQKDTFANQLREAGWMVVVDRFNQTPGLLVHDYPSVLLFENSKKSGEALVGLEEIRTKLRAQLIKITEVPVALEGN